MKIGEQTQHSLNLVREHTITPPKCGHCGQDDPRQWGSPTWDGTTEATDDGAIIWQCPQCGSYTSMGAAEICQVAASLAAPAAPVRRDPHAPTTPPPAASYEEYSDAVTRADYGEPALPGDAAALAEWDARLTAADAQRLAPDKGQ